jgi:hypothetical protein
MRTKSFTPSGLWIVRFAVVALLALGFGPLLSSRGRVLTPPPGFENALADVIQTPDGRYEAIPKMAGQARTGGAVYYVSASPTANGSGRTINYPARPDAAYNKPDVGTIVFLPGTYWRDRMIGPITKSINLIAQGPGVVLTGWQDPATLTWSQHAGKIWKCARTTVQLVADAKASVRTAWGDYPVYAQVTSLSKLTEPGRWYTDGTTVYVWPIDSRSLADDREMRLSIRITGTGIFVTGAVSVYARGIEVEGAGSFLSSYNGISGAATALGSPTISLNSCKVRYSPFNGIGCSGATVMSSVNCVASSNACDGFNYHASQTNPYVPRFLEVGCEAYRNGWGSLDVPETQNGSTSHDGVVGQRINGNYHDNYGPNIADVLGAQTWSVGCLATSSTSPNRG